MPSSLRRWNRKKKKKKKKSSDLRAHTGRPAPPRPSGGRGGLCPSQRAKGDKPAPQGERGQGNTVKKERYSYIIMLGHLCADLGGGALPAILPFLVADKGIT